MNSYMCYDRNLDIFEIRSKDFQNIVSTKEGNYGILFHFDINSNLVGISIPEPDILFGMNSEHFENFICNNFT